VGSRATMRDVAALASVSIKTVSRVVNGEVGVSDELTDRVERAARQLDYRPNLTASSLRRGGRGPGVLGLVLEDVANPFFSAVHRAVDDAAAERGLAVMATSLDEDPVKEREVARTLIARGIDGLVIVPAGFDHSYLHSEMQAGLAVVFVDRPPRFLDADTVLATNRSGARGAVQHLVAAGHRRIAFLGDQADIATAGDRLKGYADALRSAGIGIDEQLVVRDLHSRATAEQATERLLQLPADQAPTALFSSQNLVTVGAIHTLHRHGLQHRIALVGFDDLDLADVLDPGVTVVAQDPYAMGRVAAESIFARLDGYTGPSQHRTISTRLIIRGSGEIPPGERPVRPLD
jgi:LacI family transcriptional regulator